ncbi:YbaB/EbfC family nucleoid-associated protein [Coxiella endosymbiont of Ornithodoros amblus]|uniref:YbaB/EbfC family nucleoid-associated protein n=1 Tax=Coxiella endosymbiont of Ornithodoros amblus TaxID=1656166 RepID=UPI00244D9DFB|nr:YbaB/EbfC family nucleoid-associated protein [Coxiella endosymbiont of Ornithodoros amblus]MBW5802290.1 YbaB/EbfC family nucleoid-associated protein [Coxiella endosymbiont of Ornithodoros amblus]
MIGGKFNLGTLMKNAKKIQEMMQKAQDELAKIRITGESGAGMVKLTMTAQHQVVEMNLDDELLKESKEVIEDLIKAALNDTNQKILKITQEKMMSAGSLFVGNESDNEET